MAGHQLNRVLVHCRLVADAKRSTRELGHAVRRLRTTAPELCPDPDPLTRIRTGGGRECSASRTDS